MTRCSIFLGLLAVSMLMLPTTAHASQDDSLSKATQILNDIKAIRPLYLGVGEIEKPSGIVGRKGKGTINVREIYIEFGADGSTVSAWTQGNVTTEAPFTGKYIVQGDKVEFVLGPSSFKGTIKDDRITGTRRRTDGIEDNWEVTLEK